jgi:hypothetical protein
MALVIDKVDKLDYRNIEVLPMLDTPLGDQCLKAVLARWRAANPWASDIPWKKIPLQYRNEIESSATWMLTGGQGVEEIANSATEADLPADDLAA